MILWQVVDDPSQLHFRLYEDAALMHTSDHCVSGSTASALNALGWFSSQEL